jgi:hypothetical protein
VFVLLLLVFKEKNEDTKGVIRIRKSKKGRQHNVHNKEDKKTKHNTENKKNGTPLKTAGEVLGTSGTRHVLFLNDTNIM